MQREDVWKQCFLFLLGVLDVIPEFIYREDKKANWGKVEKVSEK